MTFRKNSPDFSIHPTAIVEPGAEIGDGTTVGPYSVIGPNVRLGRNNRIGSHVVIEGHTTIGDENQIYQFASVGAAPQDLKWQGEDTTLTVGDRNIIREYVTLQPGTEAGGGVTTIGDDNLFMAYSHVAHDCLIGSHVHLANAATLAGHIEVQDYANLSGLSAVHQFSRIGTHAFVSGGAMVAQDVPPYCIVQGDRARLVGLNEVGLRRHAVQEDEILVLRKAYRRLFLSNDPLAARLSAVAEIAPDLHSIAVLIAFVSGAKRGLVSTRRKETSAA
ncbi:acyl-ACP--UDP-N-acetylglucosamine O-acyltransferase [Telmatospirillum sp.]|uniref:acyl-ACP--UDP-N-acetylglucosamine O-acyltransferase n=1 Tax=Telmatospirillum sp. TaxID=2079197 RepID=UPI002846AEB1|nr:acyl-ACP--UDP-N-acetylglucosamine O-acyltransferase [Telmatospirillum sp.]MDR3435025.1 acyl-ACP--UDP-N-acetylglucosamine O-acyltransferase [Telmatospirillum sp.]